MSCFFGTKNAASNRAERPAGSPLLFMNPAAAVRNAVVRLTQWRRPVGIAAQLNSDSARGAWRSGLFNLACLTISWCLSAYPAQSQDFARPEILRMQELLIANGYSAVWPTGDLDRITGLAQSHFCIPRVCEIDTVRRSATLVPIIRVLEANLAEREGTAVPKLELVRQSNEKYVDGRFVANGRLFVTYDKSELAVWDTATGLRRSLIPIAGFALESRGSLIADPASSIVGIADSAITVVDAEQGRVVGWVPARDLRGGTGKEKEGFEYYDRVEARFIAGTTRLIAVRRDGAVVIVDWRTGEFVRKLRDLQGQNGYKSDNVVVASDGSFAATISPKEDLARVWDLKTFAQTATVQIPKVELYKVMAAVGRHFIFSTSGSANRIVAHDAVARRTFSARDDGDCTADKSFLSAIGDRPVMRRTATMDDEKKLFTVVEKHLDCSETTVLSPPVADMCGTFDCDTYSSDVDRSPSGLIAVPGRRTFGLFRAPEPHTPASTTNTPVQLLLSPQAIVADGILPLNSQTPFAVFAKTGEALTIDRDRGAVASRDALSVASRPSSRSELDTATPLPDGKGWLAVTDDGDFLMTRPGQPVRKLSLKDDKSSTGGWQIFLPRDRRKAVVVAKTSKSFGAKESILIDLESWRVLRRDVIKLLQSGLPPSRNMQGAVWGSPAVMLGDGRHLAISIAEPTIQIIDVETGRRVRQISTLPADMRFDAGSRDIVQQAGKVADVWVPHQLVASGERGLLINFGWSGNLRQLMGGLTGIIGDVTTGPVRAIKFGGAYKLAVPTLDGRSAVVAFSTGSLAMVDVETGTALKTFAETAKVTALALSPDGARAGVITMTGDIAYYDVSSGQPVGFTTAFRDGEWVTRTSDGFFDGTPAARRRLVIRTSANVVTPLDNAFDTLFRPDLVRERLAGDPDGKVKTAAARLDLVKVFASGAPPKVTITSPTAETSSSATDEVIVEAILADQGGGVGKVEWRVNGVTLGVETRGWSRIDGGKSQTVKRTLALERGDNRIEVLAYNSKDLIASDPAAVVVKWDGERTASPPKLFVLAVGVNDYYDSRLRLSYAVPDAMALAEGFQKAGSGLYAATDVTTVLDADVTTANLDRVFTELGRKIQPRDVFVFFLAGHGKTKNGRYYFLPRDFRYEDEGSIEKAGMAQDTFQSWFSRIPARKSILLYDTCESGSLTGNTRGSDIDERLGALNRMARATGRTFLTATTDDAPALEGYRGHGVFTYALLEALDHGDVNGNGLIEISELADYVDRKVPDLSFEAFKLRQIPQRSIVGSNFALTNKVAVLSAQTRAPGTLPAQPGSLKGAIAAKPTHIVVSASPLEVFDSVPPDGSTGRAIQKLEMGTPVAVIETVGGWALVARDGKQLGYTARDRLAPVQ